MVLLEYVEELIRRLKFDFYQDYERSDFFFWVWQKKSPFQRQLISKVLWKRPNKTLVSNVIHPFVLWFVVRYYKVYNNHSLMFAHRTAGCGNIDLTYCPFSKSFRPLLSSSISFDRPFSPNKVINTRASVPAPNLLPVYT